MRFSFSEDQLLLRDTVRDFMAAECPVERVRALWETETGRSSELWGKLTEIGLPGLLVPEEHGGMGLAEIELVLLLEESGRVALAEPLVSTAAVAVPLLRELGGSELGARWLGAVASGEASISVGHPVNAYLADAHIAQLLLLPNGDEIHALEPAAVRLRHEPCNDPARRIFGVEWTPSAETCLARGKEARALLGDALDRGALACAAQLLGVIQQLTDLSVRYALERRQFGVPIGSFQALKHMLADVQVKLEYARPLVYRAAHSVARLTSSRSTDVSMAKLATGDAAAQAARVSLQVHGAIGYTWEQDLHVWMRRAWSLGLAWGSGSWHRMRLERSVLDHEGTAETFGYSAPVA